MRKTKLLQKSNACMWYVAVMLPRQFLVHKGQHGACTHAAQKLGQYEQNIHTNKCVNTKMYPT